VKEYRIGYAFVWSVCLVAFLILGSYTVLYGLILLTAIPFAMRIFLGVAMKKLRVTFGSKTRVFATKDAGLYMKADGKGISKGYLSHGILLITVEVYNSLFDKKEIIQYKVSGVRNTNKINLPYTCNRCGLIIFKIKNVKLCDLLGLFGVELKSENKVQRLIVYAEKVNLKVACQSNSHCYAEGDCFDNSTKGDESGEVSDLRIYMPGDSLRRIHWKLSSKSYDNLITKEHNRPTKVDTLLYIDLGTKQQGEALSDENKLAVIRMGISLSVELLQSCVPHCLAVPTSDRIEKFHIMNVSDGIEAIDSLMCIKPAVNCGEWFEYQVLKKQNLGYSRIVCVVWENYPAELERLYKNMGVSIVMLHGKGKKMQSVSNGMFNVSAISADMLDEKEYTLVL
jgi:uncharacterized protein (DUF58 family)